MMVDNSKTLGEKKAIRVLEQAKKSIRGGKYTPKPAKARKTRKKTSK